MIFDRGVLQERLAVLPSGAQVLFGLLCAERAVACCWAFGKKEGWDVGAFYRGCDFVFEHVSTESSMDPEQLNELVGELEDAIPHSDEFGYPLATQAQSGMLALLYCLEFWKSGDLDNVVNAAGSVVDALDNYEYFVQKRLAGRAESPTEYELLDREIRWQIDCISTLAGETLPGYTLSLRVRNRAYAIPPAVDAET